MTLYLNFGEQNFPSITDLINPTQFMYFWIIHHNTKNTYTGENYRTLGLNLVANLDQPLIWSLGIFILSLRKLFLSPSLLN